MHKSLNKSRDLANCSSLTPEHFGVIRVVSLNCPLYTLISPCEVPEGSIYVKANYKELWTLDLITHCE